MIEGVAEENESMTKTKNDLRYMGERTDHKEFSDGKKSVQVYEPRHDDTGEYIPYWEVVYDGAVDFQGTKEEMLKKYPELRSYYGRMRA